MVSRNGMQPAFKMLHFVFFELFHHFRVNIHHGITRCLPVFQVFEAYPEYQVHIPLVQFPQYGLVGLLPV